MWGTQIRRPSDLGADESLRTESGRAAVRVVRATVVLAGLLFASPAATASDVGAGGAVAFSGQVIERETGKPVGGAEILLERSIRGSSARTPPAWAGTSNIQTDAQGRFRVEFPAEQVAEPRLFRFIREKRAPRLRKVDTLIPIGVVSKDSKPGGQHVHESVVSCVSHSRLQVLTH